MNAYDIANGSTVRHGRANLWRLLRPQVLADKVGVTEGMAVDGQVWWYIRKRARKAAHKAARGVITLEPRAHEVCITNEARLNSSSS